MVSMLLWYPNICIVYTEINILIQRQSNDIFNGVTHSRVSKIFNSVFSYPTVYNFIIKMKVCMLNANPNQNGFLSKVVYIIVDIEITIRFLLKLVLNYTKIIRNQYDQFVVRSTENENDKIILQINITFS